MKWFVQDSSESTLQRILSDKKPINKCSIFQRVHSMNLPMGITSDTPSIVPLWERTHETCPRLTRSPRKARWPTCCRVGSHHRRKPKQRQINWKMHPWSRVNSNMFSSVRHREFKWWMDSTFLGTSQIRIIRTAAKDTRTSWTDRAWLSASKTTVQTRNIL